MGVFYQRPNVGKELPICREMVEGTASTTYIYTCIYTSKYQVCTLRLVHSVLN